jgi:hypothetical protein
VNAAIAWNTSSLVTHSKMLMLSGSTGRYKWLSQYYWHEMAEVQDFATKWMWSYNHDRPNMALGGFTPKQRLAMAA